MQVAVLPSDTDEFDATDDPFGVHHFPTIPVPGDFIKLSAPDADQMKTFRVDFRQFYPESTDIRVVVSVSPIPSEIEREGVEVFPAGEELLENQEFGLPGPGEGDGDD